MTWLVCLCGGIASGKTTLAEALQTALPNSARLAFGDVVRRHVHAAGREPTRQNLQDMGLQLITAGWMRFVDDLLIDLTDDPEVLIVEGIRHQGAVDALNGRLPTRKRLLIYLEVGRDQQRYRLARLGETEGSIDHEVEREVTDLRAIADLVVSSEQPVVELVTMVRRIIDHRPF
ncbi:MAG: AAA family ATPase [Pseudonocardiaceae bacterium]